MQDSSAVGRRDSVGETPALLHCPPCCAALWVHCPLAALHRPPPRFSAFSPLRSLAALCVHPPFWLLSGCSLPPCLLSGCSLAAFRLDSFPPCFSELSFLLLHTISQHPSECDPIRVQVEPARVMALRGVQMVLCVSEQPPISGSCSVLGNTVDKWALTLSTRASENSIAIASVCYVPSGCSRCLPHSVCTRL